MWRTCVLSFFSKVSPSKGVTSKEHQKRRGLLEAQLRDAWIIIGIPFRTLQIWSCSFLSIFTFSTMWWISMPAGLASLLKSDMMRGISVKSPDSLWSKPLLGRLSILFRDRPLQGKPAITRMTWHSFFLASSTKELCPRLTESLYVCMQYLVHLILCREPVSEFTLLGCMRHNDAHILQILSVK